MTDQTEQLRRLPAVGKLLSETLVRGWLEVHPEALVTDALRTALEEHRGRILSGQGDDQAADPQAVLQTAEQHLRVLARPSLRRVLNATGIVLHTGLGRAPLGRQAIEAISEAAGTYCNLELNLDSGERGKRTTHIKDLICRLTGAEAATVVNNNAAATFLILKTVTTLPRTADGKGSRAKRYRSRNVIVSRGQLVEIGGSYRLPEIMKASGAQLREVGTTNRTHLSDYEQAIDERTAALMRVHTSNYRVVGFSEEVSIADLVELGRKHDLPVIDDLGSGAMVELGDEPHVRAGLDAGADVVCFSGDKLLGGPQAGIILGKPAFVKAIEKSPLMRTYRVGKLTLLALEATLRSYFDPQRARQDLPALSMLCAPVEDVRFRAERLVPLLQDKISGGSFEVIDDVSYAGGGSLPTQQMPTCVVRWKLSGRAQAVAERLRAGDPPVVARIHKDALIFDCRTVAEDEIDLLAATVSAVAANGS